MLGAFVADAIGSFLEFEQGDIPHSKVEEAMSMPGGGSWYTQPGQLTDDSELAMCQMRGLLAGQGKFDLFHICLYYGWYWHLQPICAGGTTSNGLSPQAAIRDNPNPEVS